MEREAPSRVTVLAYQVGFGDCFLVRFSYPRSNRHILIDFGSYPLPKWAGEDYLDRIARAIRDACGGKLDAVVATHRHADHINGFATSRSTSGAIIGSCDPDLIVQPWTEDPNAQPDATGPSPAFMGAVAELGDDALKRGRAFAGSLAAMSNFAEAFAREAKAIEGTEPETARELRFLGENNLSNLSAVTNLMEMGRKPGKRASYAYYGSDSGLAGILPGVEVKVLGPPTLDQSESIRKQARKHPDEYWNLLAAAAGVPDVVTAASSQAVTAGEVPPSARWLVERLRSKRGRRLLEIARNLDKVLNNTSVILLLKAGSKKLLFPGDAQIENWSYALSQEGVREELDSVNLYKVGHHGSLNATPRSLWNRFEHRQEGDAPDRLRTIVSAEEDVHGSAGSHTEVPRSTLVAELQRLSGYTTTLDLPHEPGRYAEVILEV